MDLYESKMKKKEKIYIRNKRLNYMVPKESVFKWRLNKGLREEEKEIRHLKIKMR